MERTDEMTLTNIIFIFTKSDVNLSNETTPRQQTPLAVKQFPPFANVGNNSHKITGLTNGETYTIALNKVSKHVSP